MTASTLTDLQNIGAVLCFVIPCLQIMFRQHNKWYKRVTWIGWVLLAVSAYIFLVSYFGNKAINKEQLQAKRESDSLRKADRDTLIKSVQDALKEHNLTYDTNTKTVKDTIVIRQNDINDESPILDFDVVGNNPTIIKGDSTDENKIYFQFKIRNFGKGLILNPLDYSAIFPFKNNKVEENNYQKLPMHAGNPSSMLQETAGFVYSYPLTINLSRKADTTIIFLKIEYQNKNHKPQQPFRKLVYITDGYLNQTLPDVNEDRYYLIKDFLIRKGIW